MAATLILCIGAFIALMLSVTIYDYVIKLKNEKENKK